MNQPLFYVLATLQLIGWLNAFMNSQNSNLRLSTYHRLQAKKFDPEDVITISAKKPLGLSLEEFEENSKSGVYIAELNEGSAKSSGKLRKGLYLLKVNERDVRYEDFDTVIDAIVSAADNEPLQLSFIEPSKVSKGPANLKVINGDNAILVKALKGQKMRTVLADCGIQIYDGNAVFTNCGGAGTCGTCAVEVRDNDYWYERPDFEAKRLKKYSSAARLACNTIIEGDCTIVIKPAKIVN
jgi:ferredoxin